MTLHEQSCVSLSLSLTKGNRPGQYFVSITESEQPPIEISGEFAFRSPGLIKELQALERAQFITSVGAKSQALALGRRLFNFALPEGVAGIYYALRRSLVPNRQTLRLILRIDPESSN